MPYKDKNKAREARARYRNRNKEKLRDSNRRYWLKNPDIRKRQVEKRMVLYHFQKNSIFDYYGRFCKCCGENIPKFLTIDHVYNDGYKEKELGINRYSKILNEINNGYADRYQILCMNCNFGKKVNKNICPHKDI